MPDKISVPEVIYEEPGFVVFSKPAGMLVHAVLSRKDGGHTVADWFRGRYPEASQVGDDPATRPGIVHRLDRETSGVMVAARSSEYFAHLKSLFMNRRVKKTYAAAVVGVPRPLRGRIEASIALSPGTVRRSVRGGKMEKPAVTEYCVAASSPTHALVRAHPLTGRTHQIRVHLASIGNPIAGDPLYARKRKNADAPRLMLHALSIEFESVAGKKVRIDVEPPDDFLAALAPLGLPSSREDLMDALSAPDACPGIG